MVGRCCCHPKTPSYLASSKSTIALPFRYCLPGCPGKEPVSGCSVFSFQDLIKELNIFHDFAIESGLGLCLGTSSLNFCLAPVTLTSGVRTKTFVNRI